MRRALLIIGLLLVSAAPASAGTVFVVDGRGWGHGIGLSQYGARGFASSGWSHQRILAHFYRGTRLGLLPNRRVRVLVAEGRAQLAVSSRRPFRRAPAQRKAMTLKRGTRTLTPAAVRKLGGSVRFVPGAAPLRVGDSAYRGAIVVYLQGGRLYAVNHVSLDHYLRGVVPREMPFDWPQQALRAQAIVARSYTLATLHAGERFDLYADTRDQVYDGIAAEKPSTNRAVAATAGRIVTWKGRVATTFYHSTSGGRTAAIADVWPKARAVPYLVSVRDPYDYLSKHHNWPARVLTRSQLAAELGAPGLRDVHVERNGSGRAEMVRVERGDGRTTRLPAQDVRVALGLRSTFFAVRVLSLTRPAAVVPRGAPLELTGFVRGLGSVRLQRAVAGRGWAPVRALKLTPNGRFRTIVRPDAPTRYRLANHVAAGAEIAVGVR